ncbi:MAG: SPOR domain-containing protein [Thermodesulfobacteriota bacterium]
MSDLSKNPGNKQIIYFFLGFLIFFAFSFSLGVIVGKQIGQSRDSSLDDVSKNIDIESGTGGNIIEDDQKTFLSEETETINGNGIGTEDRKFPNENEKASGVDSKIEETTTDESTPQSTRSASTEIDDNAVVAESVHKDPTSSDTQDQTGGHKAEINNRPKELTSLPPIDSEGKYTVQVGSFLEEKAAVQFLSSLKHKRYPAFIKRVVIPGYGASYRVRIGTFGTRDKAYLYGENLKRLEPNIKSVYITMND